MNCLYHCSPETVSVRVDGKLFVLPPNEICEINEVRGTDCNNNGPYEYIIPEKLVAQLIISRKPFIVEIPMVRTKGGVSSDLAAAQKQAKAALELYEDSQLAKYIEDQQDRVMKHNKSPMAPSAPILAILEKRGLDLKKDFNLEVPGLMIGKVRDRDAEIDSLREQVDRLMTALGEKKK